MRLNLKYKKGAILMLCQFVFKNYKSFKNEAFLDFMAETIKDNSDSLIIDKIDEEKILPVISIYGPNGGGKSTVLEALGYLRTFITQRIVASQMDSKNQKEEASQLVNMLLRSDFKEKYHKFDLESKNMPTTFDILFRTKGKEYKYQLSILSNEIVEENLYVKIIGERDADILFERSESECVLSEKLHGIAIEKIKKTMPLLSHIAINYDIDDIDDAISWFMQMNFVDYDNPNKERQIILPKTQRMRRKMFDMLRKMDINIADFRIEKDLDGNIENVYTKHILENGESYEILFEEESSGTRKLFSCLAEFMDCLQDGCLMVADELDAKLHPKLLRYIIELFTNPKTNKQGAQLLLTSHDISTMIPEVYRRDEIWFCALNPRNASKLYSLIAFRKENGQPPRNDEVYGKRYLEGRYGADPYIRRILDWGTEK